MDAYVNPYLKNQVETVDQKKLIVMLYEGAIGFMRRALKCMEEGDMVQKGIYLGRAMDIISELNNSLDLEKGGEIARRLRSLYFFYNRHLLEGTLKNSKKHIEDVIAMMERLKEAWEEAIKKVEEKKS